MLTPPASPLASVPTMLNAPLTTFAETPSNTIFFALISIPPTLPSPRVMTDI